MYKSLNFENGKKAELYLINILINKGYFLFAHRYRTIGNEQDIIVYKYVDKKDMLIIRAIEVKYRNRHKVLYDELGLDKKYYKFCKVKGKIVNDVLNSFNSPNSLKESDIVDINKIKVFIEFDLAIISTKYNKYYLANYIRNANLLC